MSAYCTQSDILGEIQLSDLISLTDDAPSTGNVSATILNQVISNASGTIDRMVGNLYTVPFASPVPPSVESMAIVITCYRLYRRREVPDEKNKFTEDYKETMDFLKKVKVGSEVLDLSVSKTVPPVAANQRATIFGYSPIFAPNSM